MTVLSNRGDSRTPRLQRPTAMSRLLIVRFRQTSVPCRIRQPDLSRAQSTESNKSLTVYSKSKTNTKAKGRKPRCNKPNTPSFHKATYSGRQAFPAQRSVTKGQKSLFCPKPSPDAEPGHGNSNWYTGQRIRVGR